MTIGATDVFQGLVEAGSALNSQGFFRSMRRSTRHPITLKSSGRSDETAIIGFDRPLRTFFLTGFPDPETEELEIWLGTCLEEFPSLQNIIEAARAQWYEITGLERDAIMALVKESGQKHEPTIWERLGLISQVFLESM